VETVSELPAMATFCVIAEACMMLCMKRLCIATWEVVRVAICGDKGCHTRQGFGSSEKFVFTVCSRFDILHRKMDLTEGALH